MFEVLLNAAQSNNDWLGPLGGGTAIAAVIGFIGKRWLAQNDELLKIVKEALKSMLDTVEALKSATQDAEASRTSFDEAREELTRVIDRIEARESSRVKT